MSLTDPRAFTEDGPIVEMAPHPQSIRMHCVELAVQHYADLQAANPDGVMTLSARMWEFIKNGAA